MISPALSARVRLLSLSGEDNPWYCGVNFVPSDAINDVEIWSRETFSPDVIKKEFSLAGNLGMNCVRIFLQYKVYEDDPADLEIIESVISRK